ncbi:MAG TPA: ROK family protein, partial [Opitutaceae bacterium]|nr:ROK family protein [Opitutaceae bacterium]
MTSLSPATRDLNTRPVLGFDIGGTKCALSTLGADGKVIELLRLPTRNFDETFEALLAAGQARVGLAGADVGISCGGPLDTAQGRILTPPNLSSDWYGIPIVERITSHWGGRAVLMNDANACALAEWTFGAGRGCRHMVFLTSGTGMGAGLILNGQLYEGATGDAGEIGHVRLRADGPLGYGKAGSVEGFTSGGGIARLAQHHLTKSPLSKPSWAIHDDPLTLKTIADAARAGDATALAILHEAGERLGETLAVLIDLFNPERIVL